MLNRISPAGPFRKKSILLRFLLDLSYIALNTIALQRSLTPALPAERMPSDHETY